MATASNDQIDASGENEAKDPGAPEYSPKKGITLYIRQILLFNYVSIQDISRITQHLNYYLWFF